MSIDILRSIARVLNDGLAELDKKAEEVETVEELPPVETVEEVATEQKETETKETETETKELTENEKKERLKQAMEILRGAI